MHRMSRREILQSTAVATGLTVLVGRPGYSPAASYAANEKLNIAGIGVGGQGGSHVGPSLEENLVAVCDTSEAVVDGVVGLAERTYREQNITKPLPQRFSDYRVLFDKIANRIDAVVVATPDNHHASASMMAIQRGKHVYCEKPLTHDIYEARQLTLAARQHNVATQMGNQGRAGEGWRLLCEMVWSGMIGDVTDVHVWTDRPGIPARFWWPQGAGRPAGADPTPKSLNWDVWLGPAPQRPYLGSYKEGKFKGQNVYQPFVWRGWWDFGTGALGDIGCHFMSGPFSALKVEHAAAVRLVKDSGDGTREMYPTATVICYEIPARAGMPPCNIFWYDGGQYPSRDVGELAVGKEYPENGVILVGRSGKIAFHGYAPRLIPESKMKDFKLPKQSIARCKSNHFAEWVTAAKGGRPAFSNFDHAGPLTEMTLLGNLAIRAGLDQRVQWDGPQMKCTNRPELNQFIRREYRKGWTL